MKASIVIYAALAVAAQALPQGAPKAAQPPPTQSSPQTTEIQTAAPYSPYLPMAGFAAAIANIVAFLYPGYVAGAQPVGGAYPPLPNGPPVSGTAFGHFVAEPSPADNPVSQPESIVSGSNV